MHSGAFLLSVLAIGAVATPLVERDYAYVTNVHTVVKTVTAGGYAAPHRPHRHHHKKPHHGGHPAPHYPHPVKTSHAPANTGYGSKPKPKTKPQQGSGGYKSSGLSGYQGQVIDHHNCHRANHSAPAIKWSQALADTAQKIGETCHYAHNTQMDGGGYGQNIAAGMKPSDIGDCISDAFYNGEVGYYSYYGQEPDMGNFEKWGHFSQIVWKSTTEVGCATVDCSGQGLSGLSGSNIPPYFTVCNYKGPGNFAGEYAKNIGSPLGKPTVTGDSPNV